MAQQFAVPAFCFKWPTRRRDRTNWYGPLEVSGIFYPVVWLNTGSYRTGVQTGQLSLHPGPDGEDALLRWTAPSDVSGLCSIEGQFLPGDSGIMQVAIFENGNWASPLWTGTDSGTFNLSEPLTAGDTIDFGVYGGFSSGNTPLEATITVPVPEPSTLALLGAGAVGLLGYAWRRRGRSNVLRACVQVVPINGQRVNGRNVPGVRLLAGGKALAEPE